MRSNRPGAFRRAILASLRQAAAIVVAVLFLLPPVWAISSALRAPGQPSPRTLDWIPDPIAWGNFRAAVELVDLDRYALNSVIVAAFAVPLTLVTASWAGFAIAQISQRWRLRLIALSFVALMVPLTAVWLPRFILFKEAGLIDKRLALIVPAFGATSPFYVLLFLWTFMRVPAEVYEAARLDGAGAYRVWAGIALPLARPTTMAVAVLSFTHYWSSFIEPLLYIRTTENATVPLGLHALYQLDRTDWPLLMAGALLVTIPVVLVFVVAQRAFLNELRASGWLGR
jgi:multiple sugar transport system permease protein